MSLKERGISFHFVLIENTVFPLSRFFLFYLNVFYLVLIGWVDSKCFFSFPPASHHAATLLEVHFVVTNKQKNCFV